MHKSGKLRETVEYWYRERRVQSSIPRGREEGRHKPGKPRKMADYWYREGSARPYIPREGGEGRHIGVGEEYNPWKAKRNGRILVQDSQEEGVVENIDHNKKGPCIDQWKRKACQANVISIGQQGMIARIARHSESGRQRVHPDEE